MTFKTEISQFNGYSEPEEWKGNKIRHFFSWDIFRSNIIFRSSQNTKTFM